MDLETAVAALSSGDPEAQAHVVRATQHAVYAVVRRIVSDPHEACDVVQETYLRAFRRLGTLRDVSSFSTWLRRIAVSTARNHCRDRRRFFVLGYEDSEVPLLDEGETCWTEAQRIALARAVVGLSDEERVLCERFYHGGWSVARLAETAGVPEATLRKRMQRMREHIRKEIEMSERNAVQDEPLPAELPRRIVELLGRPRLTELPESPVGAAWARAKSCLSAYREVNLPEQVDEVAVRRAFATLGEELIGSGAQEAFRIDEGRSIRTELTLPMLLAAQAQPDQPRLVAAGKVYRRLNEETPRHLEAFHQMELLRIDGSLNAWTWIGDLVALLQQLLPGRRYRIEPTVFAPCREAWSIYLQDAEEWLELLGCGVYRAEIVRALGHDPERTSAYGAGIGLDRVAMLMYGLDDIRKVSQGRLGG